MTNEDMRSSEGANCAKGGVKELLLEGGQTGGVGLTGAGTHLSCLDQWFVHRPDGMYENAAHRAAVTWSTANTQTHHKPRREQQLVVARFTTHRCGGHMTQQQAPEAQYQHDHTELVCQQRVKYGRRCRDT